MTDTVQTPKVVVIVLTWNRVREVLECVESVLTLRYPDIEIVVVDNNSADGTVEALREKFPDIRVIANEVNLGYTGGNNVGIKYALDRGAEYVVLLNNDLKVNEDLVHELVKIAETDRLIGVVGAKVLELDDPTRIWAAYGRVTYSQWLVDNIGRGCKDGPEHSQVKDVEYVIGCGIMMRREAIEKVGLFDEFLFGYHDEVDWCVRARKAGFRVVYVPSAVLYHKGVVSSDQSQEHHFPLFYFLGRNGILFAKRYARPGQLAKFLFLFTVSFVGRVIRTLFRPRLLVCEIELIKGFYHGVRNKRAPLEELGLR